jgi:YesN/AraC family two-component response regulator
VGAKILIVEDERLVAQHISQLLKDADYDICAIASDGGTAIKKIVELGPDLVLLDIRIKGETDGIEVGEHIQHFYDIPILYLTAFSDSDTLKRVKVTNPLGYILKPFRSEQLLSAISIALALHAASKPKISAQTNALPPDRSAIDYRLKSTVAYIQDHLDKNINIEMLARTIGMSPSYFCRFFHQEIGCSPYQYIIRQRVAKAKIILKQRDLSIGDAALQCGFASHTLLNRHFLKLVGTTPRNYRNDIFK